jgi:hypothetical protein
MRRREFLTISSRILAALVLGRRGFAEQTELIAEEAALWDVNDKPPLQRELL